MSDYVTRDEFHDTFRRVLGALGVSPYPLGPESGGGALLTDDGRKAALAALAPVEEAGRCPNCGKVVRHRLGKPGEFDHECTAEPRDQLASKCHDTAKQAACAGFQHGDCVPFCSRCEEFDAVCHGCGLPYSAHQDSKTDCGSGDEPASYIRPATAPEDGSGMQDRAAVKSGSAVSPADASTEAAGIEPGPQSPHQQADAAEGGDAAPNVPPMPQEPPSLHPGNSVADSRFKWMDYARALHAHATAQAEEIKRLHKEAREVDHCIEVLETNLREAKAATNKQRDLAEARVDSALADTEEVD